MITIDKSLQRVYNVTVTHMVLQIIAQAVDSGSLRLRLTRMMQT